MLYISPEGPKGGRRRVRAWRKRAMRDHPDLPADAAFQMIRQQVDFFTNDDDAKQLLKLVAAFERQAGLRCGLIVVDTMRKAMPGGNENDQKDIGIITARMQHVIEATGAAGGWIHHSGKDAAKGASGSTAIPGNVDVILRASKPKEKAQGEVTADKTRDGWLGEPLPYTLVGEDAGVKKDGTPVSVVVAVMGTAKRGGAATVTTGSAMGDVSEEMDEMTDDDLLGLPAGSLKPLKPVAAADGAETIETTAEAARGAKEQQRLAGAADAKVAAREALVGLLVTGLVPTINDRRDCMIFEPEEIGRHDAAFRVLLEGSSANFARAFKRHYLPGDALTGDTALGRITLLVSRRGSTIRVYPKG